MYVISPNSDTTYNLGDISHAQTNRIKYNDTDKYNYNNIACRYE